MFKDYDKYLTQSIKVYLFVLVVLFIMKLVGLDYFGLDTNNYAIMLIDNILSKYNLNYVYQILCLYFNFILLNNILFETKKVKYDGLYIPTLIVILTLVLKYTNNMSWYPLMNTGILFTYFIIKSKNVKRVLYVFIINIICQMLNLYVRDYNPEEYEIVANVIMNIDYYVMLIIWYHIQLKGGVLKCQEVFSFLPKKINLLILLKRLQRNLHSFNTLNKETKLTYIIYFILSLFWNMLSVLLILLVAKINDTLIECIFILTSFWLSKRTFGKAFHLSSMTLCFVVSNLTYYTLNRITTPLGISIIIPIMLGVGLSYVTSKFVKKLYNPLYKGMPKEVFEETILQVVDKDSVKYNVCYDYFINKRSAIYLANKYNYTEAGIRKIKDRVNCEIKKLK